MSDKEKQHIVDSVILLILFHLVMAIVVACLWLDLTIAGDQRTAMYLIVPSLITWLSLGGFVRRVGYE